MNILITGIHGFVGSNLVAALRENHSIYGLDILFPEKDGIIKTFSWDDIKGNNSSSSPLSSLDTIIHLTGKAHNTKNQSEAKEYFDINSGLTKIIFDYFLQSSAKQFIFFSSVKAVADSVEGDILIEEVVPRPVGPYGESKLEAEKYILSRDWRGRKVFILRPCMIHGPGNKGNLNLLYHAVRWGIPWPLGKFENRRSFTSIDNLCYVVGELLIKEIESGIYNIGDDETVSTNELIRLMCNTMNKKQYIWNFNKKFISICADIGTLLHLPLNTERLRKLTENYVVSNRKIKQALGIENMPVKAEYGFTETIKYLIANKHK
jgi:nucleoside-diphosphate-sugar epimerase